MLSRLIDLPWMRLSHSESGKAGHHGVLMMLNLTCLELIDHAQSNLRVTRSSGWSSTPSSLFRTTQGKSDSLTFFFFLIAASESIDDALNPDPVDDWEGSCDALGELGASLSLILPLLNAPEILRSCWSRILM